MATQAQLNKFVEEIHQGDIGTIFEVLIKNDNLKVDISAASTKEILFKKPSGALFVKPATFTTNGEDGKIRYITIADDLNESGVWQVQAYFIFATGKWHSDIKEFSVFPNLT